MERVGLRLGFPIIAVVLIVMAGCAPAGPARETPAGGAQPSAHRRVRAHFATGQCESGGGLFAFHERALL